MHRSMLCSLWPISGVAIGLLLTGCVSSDRQANTSTEMAGAASAPEAESVQMDPLSYGSVTSRIERGVTTQADLVHLFGGPSISTIDADGTETWVYERTASQSDVTGEGQSTIEAKRLDLYFGLGYFTTGKEKRTATGSSQYRHSIRTLTVIIKFDKDRRVREYSARASRF